MAGHVLKNITTAIRRMILPTPMRRVGLFFLSEDAPQVVSVLARLAVCQVERIPSELEDYLEPCFPQQFRDTYRRLRQLCEPLAQRWQLVGLGMIGKGPPRVPTIDEMQRMSQRLEEVARDVDEIVQDVRQLQQRQLELEHFDEYVRVLSELEIDVRTLSDLRFLHVRAGTVPVENVGRLRESAELGGDLVLLLGVRADRAHVLVVGVGGVSTDLEGLLSKAHFQPHPLTVFETVNGSHEINAQLQNESRMISTRLEQCADDDAALCEKHRDLILNASTLVARAAVFVECESVLEGRAPVSFLNGWVARDQVEPLRQALADEVPNPVAIIAQTPSDHKVQGSAPSEIVVPRIFQPGVQLVSMYGPPGYNELNPTLIIAATTPLLFGMMFGDVGHGLLLLIATIALKRWLRAWVAVGVSCSLGAIVFGFLYGSVFGVEHWLPALWMRPMDDPFLLLAVALWLGVAFVLLTFVLKTASLMRQREWAAATIGFQGIAGAVLYLSAVWLAHSIYLGNAVSLFAVVIVVAALASIGWHTGLELRQHGRSVLADLISEYFHALLTLLTNTLSFLRLAAFALAHAALSHATFLVMETIPPTAVGWVFRVVVFLLGTAIILVLDGLAVGIQTVRLQFYEGLARYYRGDGQVYRPLRFVEDWKTPPLRSASDSTT